MDRRRKAIPIPTASSWNAPESSGPRCASAAPIRFSNFRGCSAARLDCQKPAMPHMSVGCLLTFDFCRSWLDHMLKVSFSRTSPQGTTSAWKTQITVNQRGCLQLIYNSDFRRIPGQFLGKMIVHSFESGRDNLNRISFLDSAPG